MHSASALARPGRLSRTAAAFGLVALAGVACAKTSNTPGPQAGGTTSPTSAGGSTCPANAGLTGAISDKGAAAAAGTNLAIEAGDFFFKPTCETSVKAGTVTLTVRNTGQALHNVSVPDQNVDVDVSAGQTITVQVKVSGAAVPYFCKYHRTSGMVGSLVPG